MVGRTPWWLKNALWTVLYDWRPSQRRRRQYIDSLVRRAKEQVAAEDSQWNRGGPDDA